MKRIVSAASIAALLAAAVWAVLPVGELDAAEVMKYHASNQVYRSLGQKGIDAFARATGIEVDVKTASSGTCVFAMMNGYCDVASTARALDRRHRAYGYRQTPFCLDPLAVIVNASCGVDGLSEKQLQDIFSGDIVNWKDVGGEDRAITLIVPDPDTAAHKNFRRLVMKQKEMSSDFSAYNSTGVIDAVKYFPCGAISFISSGAIAGEPEVKALKIDGRAPRDEGYPYSQVFYFVTRENPKASVTRFIDYFRGEEGRGMIRQAGMVPVE